jgi:N-formylglutamate amidohydrolase
MSKRFRVPNVVVAMMVSSVMMCVGATSLYGQSPAPAGSEQAGSAEREATSASKPAADSDPLIDVQRGTAAIIITAPHGGSADVPGVPLRVNRDAYRFVIGTDAQTHRLALGMAKELERRLGVKPYFVMARFQRKYIDANRAAEHAYESPAAKPYYDAYHGTIDDYCREILKNHGGGLLIDVHGQAIYKDEILVGTVGGATVPLLRERFGPEALVGKTGMVGRLQDAGFRTMPAINTTDFHVPRFDGGFTVQNYGSHKPNGLDAIQFEFGSNYRLPEKVDDTAKRAAAAVEGFYLRYTVRNNPKGK